MPRDLSGRSPEIAYVLKSFPRLSETFIASEIYRVEQQDLRLRLCILKRSTDPFTHPVIGSIRAPRIHLPEVAPVSNVTLTSWLRRHAARFRPSVGRILLRHPAGLARATAAALGHGVRARKTRWGGFRKSAVKELLQAIALADAVADTPVRHLHAHFCHSATTVAWLASIITGLPLSFTAHAKDVYCDDLNPAGLLQRKLAAAQFVVTCTGASRAYLQSLTRTPVHCVYHGLDVEFAKLTRSLREDASPAPAIRALAVGRLVEKKGFDVFIDACARLRQRGLAVDARIVGEGGEHEAALRDQVARLGLEHLVTFTGPMARQPLFDEYRRATVFCLPSRILPNGDRDGLPNVVAEAMAAGVPVVATAVSGIPELVDDGVNGLLVAPDDAEAVADAIERLHREPALARAVVRQAHGRVMERFDGDRAVGALTSLLRGAVA